MIAVQVSNKNFIELAGVKGGAQHLVLGSFAAIKQPKPGAGWVL